MAVRVVVQLPDRNTQKMPLKKVAAALAERGYVTPSGKYYSGSGVFHTRE